MQNSNISSLIKGAFIRKITNKNNIIHMSFGALLFASLLPNTAVAVPEIPTGLCMDETICADTVKFSTSDVIAPASTDINNFNPGYYMLVGRKEGPESFRTIVNNSDFIGIKKFYQWKDVEVGEGEYDFSQIEADLAYLEANGKYLWIQIVAVAMRSNSTPFTPRYMWRDPKYGCSSTYYGTYERSAQSGGWIPCFWNSNVQARLEGLYTALGNRFNNEPFFEGITAGGETAIDVSAAKAYSSYNFNKLYQAFKNRVLSAKKAFPNKSVMQDINYGPFDLNDFSDWLISEGIGLTGPDVHLIPQKRMLREEVWPNIYNAHNKVPTAIDVQWDNYTRYNRDIGRPNTSEELRDGAIELLNPWYMFWKKRAPYFNEDVIPAVRNRPLPAAEAFNNLR